jgi:hypothetical protein
MSPDERLSRLAKFRGYGDYSSSRFLYIGIEEGLALTEEMLDRHLAESSINSLWEIPVQEAKPKNITENMQARLSIKLLEKFGESQVCTKVVEYDLSKKNEFCANIYPFGAKSQEDQPPQYKHLLGKKKEEAQCSIVEERKVLIKEMIKDFIGREGGLVFIFGKSAHGFLYQHQILEELEIKISDARIEFGGKRPYPIRYSTDFTVWLTGHPSHGWFGHKAITKIIDTITIQPVCKEST